MLLPFSARLPVGQKMRKLFGVWFNTLPEEWPHAEFDFGDVTNKQCQELEMFYLNHCKQSFGGECDHFWQIAEVALEDRRHKRQWIHHTQFNEYFRYKKTCTSRSSLPRKIVDAYCLQKHKVLKAAGCLDNIGLSNKFKRRMEEFSQLYFQGFQEPLLRAVFMCSMQI